MNIFVGILIKIKYYLLLCLIYAKSFFVHNFTAHKKAIYILSTPRHGNLGDHAIVYSQYKLFEELGYKKNLIEVNKDTYALFKDRISKIVTNRDLIIIDGGGNIGTLWLEEEYIMRDIIQTYTENSVVIMPQTAYFEDSPLGQQELQRSIEVYCNHNDLTVFCRDVDTYNLMSAKFVGVQSFYVPDMVMMLTNEQKNCRRSGALLCLREDVEKTCSIVTENKITELLKANNYFVKKSSTIVERTVEFWQRKLELKNKWKEFSTSEIVVTDRLHGMVFAAITATPCLAIDNISHKVKNGYKWLSHLPYIVFCNNVVEINEHLEDVIRKSQGDYTYSCSEFEENCNLLKEHILIKLKDS